MEESVRSLSPDDTKQILKLIDVCLKNNDNLYLSNILYTKRNIDNFFKLEIFPLIIEEEPTAGYFINDSLIGLVSCSLKLNKFYDCSKKIALGGITMVHPDFRGQGVSKKLRKKMYSLLKNRGVNKFIFDLSYQNQASFKSAESVSKEINTEANIVCFRAEAEIEND